MLNLLKNEIYLICLLNYTKATSVMEHKVYIYIYIGS